MDFREEETRPLAISTDEDSFERAAALNVACDVGAVFGGVGGERFPPPASEQSPRLRLTGMVVAGGLCVR